MVCEKCGHDIQIGDFPFCKGQKADHVGGINGRIGDEIDVWVRNGLCNPDDSPRHYTSREELKREEKKRGYENYVVHRGSRGGDKSKFTSR